MKFSSAVDAYVTDQFAQGRFTSKQTEVGYRAALNVLAEVCGNRDPGLVGRDDIKKALANWPNPNSRAKNHSVYRAFWDWALEEGLAKSNPAREVQRVRKREPSVYQLNLDEIKALLGAVRGQRERRVIWIGVFAGLRSQELRGLQGRHFARPGWLWVSGDIAKRGDERWVPILDELRPIAEEIRRSVEADEYVLPAQRWRNPPINTEVKDLKRAPMSKQALYQLFLRVGKRAGIAGRTHPHLARHAFGSLMSRYAGMRQTQALMGHKGIATTEGYLDRLTPDELSQSVAGFRVGVVEQRFLWTPEEAHLADYEKSEPEHREQALHGLEPNLAAWLESQAGKVAVYAETFGAV